MTETQAKAGASEAEGQEKSGEQPHDAAASTTGSPGAADATVSKDSPAEEAEGRSAVGRATVPGGEQTSTAGVKYTRPPGMPAPPDAPPPGSAGAPGSAGPLGTPGTGGPAAASHLGQPPPTGTVPTVARASVRTTGPAASLSLGAPPGGGATATGSVMGAGRVTEAVRAARATVAAAAGRGPRRARLHVKRIDPWSVMKFAFAVSFVLFIVVIVAASVLYLALDAMGVFGSVNKAMVDLIGATGGDAASVKITAKFVIGGSAMVGLVNVVLFTALATLGAFIYNVCADLVGGIELTLAEKD
ncbi:MAG: DUF3566 domain-containing protein [Dactylosporangium sp.]|nr:DUF3566 domain-containing protein [Dactylosporangium sp.]NNJ61051.1 DUF3566 domain-containing protein [Dactylosporangium sp.]